MDTDGTTPTGTKRWGDLSSKQRRGLVGLGVLEMALTAVALRDLGRRPRDEIRGRKLAWLPLLFVQPLGPVLYLLLGRRRPSTD